MLYLMNFLKVDYLIGFNRVRIAKELGAFFQNGEHDEIVKSLTAKHILVSKRPHTCELNPEIINILDTLFFPERVLVVMRNTSIIGRQVFYVMKKGKSLVLHSLPKSREHFIHPFAQPINLYQFLLNWFPLSRLLISTSHFEIRKDIYIQVRSFMESGKMEEALDLLQSKTLESDDTKSFFRALSENEVKRRHSWVSIQEAKAKLEDILSIVSDGRTGWLMSETKASTPEGTMISIHQTGPDFTSEIRNLVERFTDEKLSKKQTYISGKFIRYTLSLDEFTMALAAVNCVELSTKLYAAISRDSKREQYADRMDKAQKSLMEHGLCTKTDRGLPVLNEDLAEAVYAVAKANSMIQIKVTGNGPSADTGILSSPWAVFLRILQLWRKLTDFRVWKVRRHGGLFGVFISCF